MTAETSPPSNPARALAASWLERNGWKEKLSEEDFEELSNDVGVLLRDVEEEAQNTVIEARGAAAVAALGRAVRTCEAFAKGVIAEASAAPDAATADRFRAMARAHERDAQSIGKLAKAIGAKGKKR